MSACSSMVETEDLYCDDELHPSLENDPNMQLLTTAMLSAAAAEHDEDLTDDGAPIFQSLDRGFVFFVFHLPTAFQ